MNQSRIYREVLFCIFSQTVTVPYNHNVRRLFDMALEKASNITLERVRITVHSSFNCRVLVQTAYGHGALTFLNFHTARIAILQMNTKMQKNEIQQQTCVNRPVIESCSQNVALAWNCRYHNYTSMVFLVYAFEPRMSRSRGRAMQKSVHVSKFWSMLCDTVTIWLP